jgi:hypothetical protein
MQNQEGLIKVIPAGSCDPVASITECEASILVQSGKARWRGGRRKSRIKLRSTEHTPVLNGIDLLTVSRSNLLSGELSPRQRKTFSVNEKRMNS